MLVETHVLFVLTDIIKLFLLNCLHLMLFNALI